MYGIFFLALNPAFSRAEDLPDASDESHPGLGMEARYAEAVVAYNRKQTELAISILDQLIKSAPQNTEYLELKALSLKGKGDEGKSIEIYKKLYDLKPEKERGPYAFEIGSILDKQKKPAEAKPYFEKAIELDFNVAASHFYLGMNDFQTSNFGGAVQHFEVVSRSGIADLELVGRYYLSLSYFKTNNGTLGIQELVDAREYARQRESTHANAKTIAEATNKMLDPFKVGQWFGNIALMTQYDSNVQQLPSGISNLNVASNKSSIKENAIAGIGYMSAPIDPIQWVLGYRASVNYNFNQETKAYEYFTNSASLFLNYHSLARTSTGLKFETNFGFQNALSDPTNTQSDYLFQKFNLTFSAGPYIRHQFNREWRGDLEGSYRTQKYYMDSNQSGKVFNVRASLRRETGETLFNPGLSTMFEGNNATGIQYYYSAAGLGLMNSMYLPGSMILTQSLDVLVTDYSKSTPHRVDNNWTFRLGAVKQLSPKWALMADFSFIDNFSTVSASYRYERIMTSVGASYNL